jgi:hypothetical protein
LGLDRNEKRIYVIKERTTQDIERALGEVSFDDRSCLASGQLSVLAKEDAYI